MSRLALLLAAALGLTLGACAHHRASGAAEPPAPGPIETREVVYTSEGTTLKGFMAYPAGTTPRPGVLVVHEWWGLNDYIRSRAEKLAQAGFVALAVDMYGDGRSTTHPQDAQKFAQEVMNNRQQAARRFEAAHQLLKSDPRVDPQKIAAIGYCFGGAAALYMARNGADLDVVAAFHANLTSDKPMPQGFQGKILVATGTADPFVPPEQVAAFKKEMDAAGVNYELVEYPGAKHAFTNPGATALGTQFNMPFAYDEAADADSWAKLLQILHDAWK